MKVKGKHSSFSVDYDLYLISENAEDRKILSDIKKDHLLKVTGFTTVAGGEICQILFSEVSEKTPV